jgi:bifunctional non-homologous end joining protein LigD
MKRSTAPMPHHVKPMMATLVEEPFDRANWCFEVKWDGYRAVAEVRRRKVDLYSRNFLSFKSKFEPIVAALRSFKNDVILDGEIVVVDENGRSQFQLLQNYTRTGVGSLHYYVFDVLYLDGRDLREEPWHERRSRLAALLESLPNVHLSEAVEEKGVGLFRAASKLGLEGIIAKNQDSSYRSGIRSRDWLKIKTRMRQEAVIAGYTAPRGSRAHFGALVLGVHDDRELTYIGHTGSGFDTATLADLKRRLKPLERQRCPFITRPRVNAPVQWVEPRLVCEVVFQEWTNDGHMRQPIFVGLREDKQARDVRHERPRKVHTSR